MNQLTISQKSIYLKFILLSSLFLILALNTKSQVRFLEKTVQELINKATNENKTVFIFVSDGNNESWWMEQNVFNDSEVAKFYNKNFISGIIYGEAKSINLGDKKVKITGYPFMLYYDPNSGEGYSTSGGKTVEQIISYGKTVSNEFKLLNVINRKVNSLDSGAVSATYKIQDNDGRFALGVQGRRLMYGYPYPNSTSHFIINVNNKMASNSPRFLIQRDLDIADYLEKKNFFSKIFRIFKKKTKKMKIKAYKNVTYLRDTLLIHFDKSNSMYSKISYNFNNLIITQKLSPLNKELEISKPNDSTRYYKVEYSVQNTSNKPISAGILILFDMMIDDNDAAQMDVFKSSTIGKRTIEQKRLRGRYAKYTKLDNLKRILVYRNKKLTDDLTGDFRIVSQPDEIHIGSWPQFYSVLWEMPDTKIGTKYYDSAVILKWNTDSLAAGEVRNYTTVFGLYNDGILELVPAGTNFSGSKKDGKRIKQAQPELTVTPDTIYEGQSALLEWNAENPLNADIYISAKAKHKQRNKGRTYVKPKTTTTYNLQMLDQGKEIFNVKTKLVVIKRPPKVSFDGRFSIGSKDAPITFGYPYPYSTSYFQLYQGKKYYSNNKITDNTFLEGKQYVNTHPKNKNVLTYESDNFIIIQRLIPLNKEFKKTDIDSAVFFKCEYCIKNKTKNTSTFSFKQLLDLSVINTDNLNLKVNGKKSVFNLTYIGERLARNIILSDKDDNSGIKIFTNPKGSKRPKSVSIGDWHFLKKLDIKTRYSDSSFYRSPAVLLRWKEKIYSKDSVKFAFIIGANQNKTLKYKYNKSTKTKSLTINFETNKHKLSKIKIDEIISFIEKNEFDFVVLEGFSDNRGSLENNYQLAQKRIDFINELIINKGKLDKESILKKVHGEFFSNEKANNKEVDDEDERKVNIVLFKIEKD